MNIESIRKDRVPVTIVTSKGVYHNMVLRSITATTAVFVQLGWPYVA